MGWQWEVSDADVFIRNRIVDLANSKGVFLRMSWRCLQDEKVMGPFTEGQFRSMVRREELWDKFSWGKCHGYITGGLYNYLHNTFFAGKYGATPGKIVNGLIWVREIGALPLLIGYSGMLFDVKRRGLHDWVCDTRVICQREYIKEDIPGKGA